jgi:hypothetical protein
MVIQVSANNGQAPASALAAMPGRNGDGSQQTSPIQVVASYGRLRAQMQRAGMGDLIPSSGWSCYRDRAAQQHMRDIGLTTIPVGQSIHGEWSLGGAVDFSNLGGFGAARHNWLRANGGPYGWYQPGWAQAGGSLPEPWHWEYDQRGDSHINDVTPEPEPEPVPIPEDEDMNIIRIIEDGRLILVGTYQFQTIATMDDYNALAQLWGAYQDMGIGDAQRVNDQVNKNISDWAHSMAVNIPPLLPPTTQTASAQNTRQVALVAFILSLAELVGLTVALRGNGASDDVAAYAGGGTLLGGLLVYVVAGLAGWRKHSSSEDS